MKQAIQEKLTHIAHTEPLHFLLAVESGSRAWGFASPDSDYDVRAIYIRPQEYYLQIDEAKDTFEFIENQWFYVLRPLLAARWAVKQGGIPPMTLAELMSEWQTDCAAQIADLVAIKAEQDESYLHTLSPELQRLTVDLYNEVSELSTPAAQAADSGPLNELFRETLAAIYP